MNSQSISEITVAMVWNHLMSVDPYEWTPHPAGGRFRITKVVHDTVQVEYQPVAAINFIQVDVNIGAGK